MPFRVAVDRARIEAADYVRPVAHRLLHQLDRAGPDEHPALRKSDDLDVDCVTQVFSRPQHALETAQADIGVDVDERANLGRAGRDHPAGDPAGLDVGIDPPLAAQRPLVLDLVEQRRANLVPIPAEAEEGLVDVGVGVDEAGEDQPALSLDDDLLRRCQVRPQFGNPAVCDPDVGRTAAERADITDKD